MARAMRSMKRWRDKLYMLVARPGWFPEEMGGYQAPPPVEEHKPKYDASAPAALNGYLLAQFALITLGLVAYMTYFTEIGLGYQVLFLALMVVSTMIVGALMEQRGWVRYAELVRLLLVVVSLNAVYWTHYSHWLALFMPLSVISCLALATWYLLRLRHIPA
jgi:alkylglycerol monooxygenase